MSASKKTPYYDIHKKYKANIVDFVGFLMPIQYEGIKKEHMAVRTAAGLFDVSHMGEVIFQGKDAVKSVDYLVPNDVASLPSGHALYTPICRPNGGIVDDCIVYKRSDDDILIVVNASNIEKDFAWFKENSPSTVPVNVSDDYALLALQGPKASEILSKMDPKVDLNSIPGFGLGYVNLFGEKVMIARTGYTGEDGFEIFVSPKIAEQTWETIMEKGKEFGIKPAGLGARDTLRLESKLWLYGNDINDSTTPIEAGMNFTLKLNKGDFIGREALLKQKSEKPSKKLVGFEVVGKGIPRQHYKVHLAGNEDSPFGEEIGEVTSGTKTPYLKKSIGMAYVPRKYSKSGTKLIINAKGKPLNAVIVKGPFYKRNY